MGSTREVVTLQLGHYANFIGVHWWNLQESSFVYSPSEEKEINHDVLFREGENLNGDVTYTPRMVAFDLKGSLNSLPQEGSLYTVPVMAENIPWQSDVTLHKLDSVPKNDFLQDLEAEEKALDSMDTDKEECVLKQDVAESSQGDGEPLYVSKMYNLDDKVNVWSDFLRVHWHPNSVHIVEQYEHEGDMDFDVFGCGSEIYKDYDSHGVIEDKLHFFLEECDHLQGIQLLVDPYNGFGGLAGSMLEDLADDYGSKALFSVTASPSSFSKNLIRDKCHRAVNTVLTHDSLLSHSSAVLPLAVPPPGTFPYINYNTALPYHSAAILAAGLESATMPYRHFQSPSPMTSMLQSLSSSGHKLLCLQSSFPYPLRRQESLVDSLLGLDGQVPWHSLTPLCSTDAKPWSQSVNIRGLSPARIKSARGDVPSVLEQCTTMEEIFQLYLTEICGTQMNHICTVKSPLKLQSPYPHVFKPCVSATGELTDGRSRPNDTAVGDIAMMTALQSTSSSQHYLKQMLSSVKNFNINKFHKFLEAGLEEDDYKESLDRLQSIHEQYLD